MGLVVKVRIVLSYYSSLQMNLLKPIGFPLSRGRRHGWCLTLFLVHLINISFSIRIKFWNSLGLFLIYLFIHDYLNLLLHFSKVNSVLVTKFSHVLICLESHEMLSKIFVPSGSELLHLVLESYC